MNSENCTDIQYVNNGMRSHIIDSIFFGNGFSTAEGRNITSDLTRMQRWLDVEIVLAESLAEIGVIPFEVVKELKQSGKLANLDIDAIRKGIEATEHSLMPLLNAWQQKVSEEAGHFIHYGATTQDIQDTAQVMEIKDFIAIFERDLKAIIRSLTALAKKYRDLPIIGRTHSQHALPSILGIKIAGWLDENIRNYDRLQACKQNILVSQLFGGVGSMSGFPREGNLLLEIFSEKLGVGTARASWHNARDRIAEFLTVLALITGGLSRIANEIIALSKNEIAELAEPFLKGRIGSSTMPHKRNPEICERVVVLARLVKGNASLSFDGLCSEHERDYRSVRLEWVTVSDACHYTCCALALMKPTIANLEVLHRNIARNFQASLESISSERIMFSIGEKIGKHVAHTLVYKASMRRAENNSSIVEELFKEPEIADNFSQQEIRAMTEVLPDQAFAKELVDNLVNFAERRFGYSSLTDDNSSGEFLAEVETSAVHSTP